MSTLKKALKARELSSFLFLIVLFIIVSLINPTFASSDNISACFNSAVVYILIAVGMAFAIIVGEIDVSVGSNLGFVATVVGSLLRDGCNWLVAFAVGILIGALVGLINGWGVAVMGVPSLIFTLGVNGVLRGAVRSKESIVYPDAEKDPRQYLALKEFHPDWLVKRWLKQFGFEGAQALCRFDNEPPPLTLRVNTLVSDRKTLLASLQEDGFEAEPSKWCEDGIVCTKIPALSVLFSKYNDMFYVQDESSMLVASVLAPQPGQTVIDVCSAPGGKTTHLAQLMQNKGVIYATDIHEHKIKLIEENSRRLGITIIEPSLQDAAEFKPEWESMADCVLVDAPCSGLGVLRRRAEARWKKNKIDLKTFPPLQRDILRNAARYVKPGGRLVYSTCTLEQAENHYIPDEFLENNPNWQYAGFQHPLTGETVDELQLLPQHDGTDGFYICALVRKE